MADKFHSDTGEKIETITYAPQLQDSGDLETGSHTIVPTSRPVITAAQYSRSLTLPRPDDARLEIKRIASRLKVNITGLGTATHVYLSVRVDQDDADHELFSEDWTTVGEKLDAVDVHVANKSAIFDLLQNGAAHTFYFLFWANAASQVTIDTVELWEGVGSCSTNENQPGCLLLNHAGDLSDMVLFITLGTGTTTFRRQDSVDNSCFFTKDMSNYSRKTINCLLVNELVYNASGTIATDLNYVHVIVINLRIRW
ncbi:MAG: hypothetical protein PHE50_07470 [Dehalococcoidales bacterium]|nr:hypothetical protein [Dehalococcoidales bacterium]